MDNTVLMIILGVVGLSFLLTLVALIDLIKKDFPSLKEKFAWHLVAIVPVIGWAVYFTLGARKGKKKQFTP